MRDQEEAGICKASEYRWSCYALYGKSGSFVDIGMLERVVRDREDYAAWIAEATDEECLEYIPPRHDDAWALKVIHKQLNGQSGTTLQNMDRAERNEAPRKMKKAGLSVRQIERLTGINRGIVQKA